MPKRLDLVGKKFGQLTVLEFYDVNHGMSRWRCRCDCGNETIVYGNHMLSGNTQSCGCVGREKRRKACTKHGQSHARIYQVWADMKDRCYNPNNCAYEYYGGKGIRVCDDWLIPNNFFEWAFANGYDDSLTIDRLDANGWYEPNNCRWVTQHDNVLAMLHSKSKKHWAINYSTGKRFEFTIIKDFARAHGLNHRIVSAILRGEHRPINDWDFGVVS